MSLDSREFRDVVGIFATGVSVVTSGSTPNIHGMTINAFASLSLEPPLVLVCVDRSAHMQHVLKETGAFTINVLRASQRETSIYFADGNRPSGLAEFAKVPHDFSLKGTPRLLEALAVLDCTVHDVLEGGDHMIFLGRVEALEIRDVVDPLLYYRGTYRTIAPQDGV